MNNQFFLPTAVGRIEFSIRLCRFGTYAAWRLRTPVFRRAQQHLMVVDAA